jgi:hypothetical protein
MKFIKNMMLAFKYGSIFSINRIIIILELIIVLVLGNIAFNHLLIDNANRTELRALVANNIVIYDMEDEEQVEYCTKNGNPIDYNYPYLYFYKESPDRPLRDGFNTRVYSREYLNIVKLPLKIGKWFDDIDIGEYDFIVVIPYKFRKDLKVGKTYKLYTTLEDENAKYTVYVAGLLKPYIHSDEIICLDAKGIIPHEKRYEYNNMKYARLDYFDTNELAQLGIVRFDEEYKRVLEINKSDRGFLVILISTLYTIFLCGFTGDRILNIDTYTKTFATMFLCGATRRKALTMLFLQNIPVVLTSGLISYFLIKYLYRVEFKYMFFNTTAFFGFIAITLAIHVLLSFLVLSIISKQSPVGIISGRDI